MIRRQIKKIQKAVDKINGRVFGAKAKPITVEKRQKITERLDQLAREIADVRERVNDAELIPA